MLYELVVGVKPFVAADIAEMLQMQHVRGADSAAAGGARTAHLGGARARHLARAAKERDQRFADAAAFRDALDATPEGRDGARAMPGAGGRMPRYAIAIAVAALVLASIGVAFAIHAH